MSDESDMRKFVKEIAPLIVKLSENLVIDKKALNRFAIKSMGIDYAAYDLPDEVWEFLIPKLFKLYYRVSQGDTVTRGDMHKLIIRELKKIVKPQSKGGSDGRS